MSSTFAPRLVTSRQWTELPDDFLSKVREVFKNQFKHEVTKGEFIVDGRIYPDEVLVRVGYLEKGRLKQINFEASMDIPKDASGTLSDSDSESRLMNQLFVCIDALGSLMEEYFQLAEGDEMDVPNYWRAYEFEGDMVFLQHSTTNTRLEEEADRLLGLTDKKLFNEESPADAASEDAMKKAEIDSELAFEVQKIIRSGRYPRPATEMDPEDELN